MAGKVGSSTGEQDVMGEMNVVPLIDVMLVLLVMLIVTIPIQSHAVKLDMPTPNANPPQAVQVQPVNLEVDFDGTVIWNGVPVPGRGTLIRYFQDVAAQQPQPEIHLLPNRLAKYGTVAQVLADAQRNHVTKIGFVGTAQYLD